MWRDFCQIRGVVNTFAYAYGASGLAFNSAGDLFVADYDFGSTTEITPSGTRSTFAFLGSVGPTFLAFGPAYNIVNFPPAFQTTTASGGNFIFSWNTVNAYPFVSYQVQYSTNLATANWINLGGVLSGTGPTLSVTNAIGSDPQRFYRILLVQ
jgi:hypothetical protein